MATNKESDKKHPDEVKKMNPASEKAGEKLPGEYPPQEDIMNRLNQVQRVNIPLENFNRTLGGASLDPEETDNTTQPQNRQDEPIPEIEDETDLDTERDESDITKEDLMALGPKDMSLSMDMGDDELLKERWMQNLDGEDLDVPGAELDDASENIGAEDEENNYYSLGGDNHEDLENPSLG